MLNIVVVNCKGRILWKDNIETDHTEIWSKCLDLVGSNCSLSFGMWWQTLKVPQKEEFLDYLISINLFKTLLHVADSLVVSVLSTAKFTLVRNVHPRIMTKDFLCAAINAKFIITDIYLYVIYLMMLSVGKLCTLK